MSLQTQGPFKAVAAITVGIFVVAALVLVGLGDYGLVSGVFLALLIAMLSGIVLFLGFGGTMFAPVSEPAPAQMAASVEPPVEPKPEPEAAQLSEPEPEQDPTPVPEPQPSPSAAGGGAQGVRPTGIDGARGGQADDLKRIKGIGPKLEKLCNSLGFWHYDQIAAWADSEVAWVDDNLEGFKGRVTRDKWVEQAKTLAAEA